MTLLVKSVTSSLLLVAGICLNVYPQENVMSTSSVDIYFDKITGIENSGIINGRQYRMGQLGAKSNPFFVDGEAKGMVKYNGNSYHVPLLYDVAKDQLVVKHISAQGLAWFIQLEKSLVHEFVISDRRFRRFDRGFHEVIFEGNDLMILARRAKVGKTEKGIFNYLPDDSYFLLASGRWSPLRNAVGFSKILDDKSDRKELKSFIQKRGIKVRKFKHQDLAALGTFLVQLRNKKPS